MNTTMQQSQLATQRFRTRGFTLVEIMVALAVGAILTAGAVQIFASSRGAFHANDALARVQESGRYSLQFLRRDIRGAGFFGCSPGEINSTLNSSSTMDFEGPPLSGSDGSSGTGNIADLSDTLTMRFASPQKRLNMKNAMPKESSALTVEENSGIEVGDVLMVTDCTQADVFQVTNTQSNGSSIVHNSGDGGGSFSPGNDTGKLSQVYDTSATVYKAFDITYSVTTDSDGNPRLQRTVNGDTEVIVEGVHNMQITYGEDSDPQQSGTAIWYTNAANVTNWDAVIAVRIELTARSGSEVVRDTATTIDVDNDGTDEDSYRLFDEFIATVGVRNRLP